MVGEAAPSNGLIGPIEGNKPGLIGIERPHCDYSRSGTIDGLPKTCRQ